MPAAKGALLKGKNTTYQSISGLGDFDFPFPEVQLEDTTNHATAANQEEKTPTIFQAPVITVPIVKWDNTDTMHAWLATNNGTVQAFGYTGAGKATEHKFNAIIMLAVSNPVKGVQKGTLKLAVSDGNTPT